MKNTIKNMLAAGILTSAFMVGATSVKAGLLVSDFAPAPTDNCSQSTVDSLIEYGENAATLAGILLTDRTGLLVSDRAGLLMSDRSGLLVSDRSGILMTDRSVAGEGCKE